MDCGNGGEGIGVSEDALGWAGSIAGTEAVGMTGVGVIVRVGEGRGVRVGNNVSVTCTGGTDGVGTDVLSCAGSMPGSGVIVATTGSNTGVAAGSAHTVGVGEDCNISIIASSSETGFWRAKIKRLRSRIQ